MDENHSYSKLRELRKLRGLTVNKLADKIGEDHQKVGRIERGQSSFTVDYLMKVSRGLNVPVEDILEEKLDVKNHVLSDESDRDLISLIVSCVDEQLSTQFGSKTKGKIVSGLYELSKQLPQEFHKSIIASFLQLFLLVRDEV